MNMKFPRNTDCGLVLLEDIDIFLEHANNRTRPFERSHPASCHICVRPWKKESRHMIGNPLSTCIFLCMNLWVCDNNPFAEDLQALGRLAPCLAAHV